MAAWQHGIGQHFGGFRQLRVPLRQKLALQRHLLALDRIGIGLCGTVVRRIVGVETSFTQDVAGFTFPQFFRQYALCRCIVRDFVRHDRVCRLALAKTAALATKYRAVNCHTECSLFQASNSVRG